MMPIRSKSKRSPQHIGLGKKLILEAERITQEEFNLKKIAVISGVGVREYYRKTRPYDKLPLFLICHPRIFSEAIA